MGTLNLTETHSILGQILPVMAVWGAGCHLQKYCPRLIISCLDKLSDQTAKSKFWQAREMGRGEGIGGDMLAGICLS